MQIEVLGCQNSPPAITAIQEICVIAGDTIDILISVTDPDTNQLVLVSASGGPFEVNGNKAELISTGGFQSPPFQARLIWAPSCEQIRDQAYTVIIKAIDNLFDTTGLVDLHAIRIKVLGPPPQGLDIANEGGAFQLTWDLPYACDMAAGNYFKGFSIWKRSGSNQFVPDSCENGLNGRGYTQIAANWKGTRNGRYHFEDADVGEEGSYCYRILAEFAQTTPFGQPYLRVVSIPSEEVCLRTNADLPLLTHVTVDQTDPLNGQITIKWLAPDPLVLDTISNAGPYRYVLMFAPGIDGSNFQPVPGAAFSSTTFTGLKDTVAIHTGIDTRSQGYTYRMDFYAGSAGALYGSSQSASSVFLTATPSDEASQLHWAYHTPWDNFAFDIWRSDQGGPYQFIATVDNDSYTDNANVENGLEYCYRIIAHGDYGLMDIVSPLLNQSQIACVIPYDNVAPCPPQLQVTNICDEATPGTPADAFVNYVSWQLVCSDDDIDRFTIYYALNPGDAKVLVGEVPATEKSFEHKPGERIAGCYTVVAIDENGNESEFSSQVCVTNCPVYELPNAFTPNGDGQNDLYKPFRSRFIESINFSVFNRWGQLVYSTHDPGINWNGENTSGKPVSDGVYYYTCEAFESQNQSPISLSGYIELIRG